MSKKEEFNIYDIDPINNKGFKQNEEMLKTIISGCNKKTLIDRFNPYIALRIIGFDDLTENDFVEEYKIDSIYVYKIMQGETPIDYFISEVPLFSKEQSNGVMLYSIIDHPFVEYSNGGTHKCMKEFDGSYTIGKFIGFCEKLKRTLLVSSMGTFKEGSLGSYKPLSDYRLALLDPFHTDYSKQTDAYNSGNIFEFLKNPTPRRLSHDSYSVKIFENIIDGINAASLSVKNDKENDKRGILKSFLKRNKELDEEIDAFAPSGRSK